MKTKKLLAVALAAGMLIGGGTKALDLAIPTAYATEAKSLEQLEADLKAAKKEQEDLQNKKTVSENNLKNIRIKLKSKKIKQEEREELKKQEQKETENIAKYTEDLKKVENQITELEKKIEEAKRAPVQEFEIKVTTTDPKNNVTETTVTGKDVNEAKENVEKGVKKIYGYIAKIEYSADNKTATVTYEKDPNALYNYNSSLQILPLIGKWENVPGATIEVKNADTGEVINTFTTTDGYSHFKAKAGNYEITVTNVPTDGVLAGKKWKWNSPQTRTFSLPVAASMPFHLYEVFTLVSKYVDTDGNTIAPEETVELDRFELRSFKPNPKEIEGYKYKELRNEGSLQEGIGTFTYVYEALYTRFVDEAGNDIAPKAKGIKEPLYIVGYKWMNTIKDDKGNITYVYQAVTDEKPENPTPDPDKKPETQPDKKPEDKPEIKPEDGKDNSDENKAKDLIDKLNKNTSEIEKILKENEANQEEPSKDPEKEPDKKPDKKPEKKDGKKAPSKKKSNPKTGITGISLVAGTLATASAALVATKKKNK